MKAALFLAFVVVLASSAVLAQSKLIAKEKPKLASVISVDADSVFAQGVWRPDNPNEHNKDSKVIGQAWATANKDKSRDKRFGNNSQIPIALYGDLSMKSNSGLWKEFQFSDPERLKRFLETCLV